MSHRGKALHKDKSLIKVRSQQWRFEKHKKRRLRRFHKNVKHLRDRAKTQGRVLIKQIYKSLMWSHSENEQLLMTLPWLPNQASTSTNQVLNCDMSEIVLTLKSFPVLWNHWCTFNLQRKWVFLRLLWTSVVWSRPWKCSLQMLTYQQTEGPIGSWLVSSRACRLTCIMGWYRESRICLSLFFASLLQF